MKHRKLFWCEPELIEKAELLLDRLKTESGIEMLPYFGLRSPMEQARLWRQSRSSHQIEQAYHRMKQNGAHWLADVLLKAGPQYGKRVTGALPGQSWHQWGEAMDCYWLKEGRAEWNDLTGYGEYRRLALDVGFNIGPEWDWGHVQLSPEGRPQMSWAEIDKIMQDKWGNF